MSAITQSVTRLDNTQIETRTLDEKIVALMDSAAVTGLGITIFNNDQTVYKRTFGFANIEEGDRLKTSDVFYGASLSKAVFGYIVALLADDGIIDLDKPLQEYLDVEIPDMEFEKEWRSLAPLKDDKRYRLITARMCLSHTTGLPNWRWIEDDKTLKFLYAPGERYSYSGEGIMLLQWAVERITGKTLEELSRTMVFDPLGMHHTTYVWPDEVKAQFVYGHDSGQNVIPLDVEMEEAGAAGSMETTLDDYSRFVEHIMQLETVGSSVTRLMFTPNIRIRSKAQFGPLAREDSTANDEIALNYGLGWGLLMSPYGKGAFKEGHDSGYQHYSIIFPEADIGVIIMTNSDNGESIFKQLLELSISDSYTPWQWENYIPYDQLRK